MSKKFYSHIIEIESLTIELDKLDLSETERVHLASLVDSNLHHTILDAVMSELAEEDKQVLLEHLKSDDHEKIWKLLNERVDDIEEKIRKTAKQLKDEMHGDIKDSKRLGRD